MTLEWVLFAGLFYAGMTGVMAVAWPRPWGLLYVSALAAFAAPSWQDYLAGMLAAGVVFMLTNLAIAAVDEQLERRRDQA